MWGLKATTSIGHRGLSVLPSGSTCATLLRSLLCTEWRHFPAGGSINEVPSGKMAFGRQCLLSSEALRSSVPIGGCRARDSCIPRAIHGQGARAARIRNRPSEAGTDKSSMQSSRHPRAGARGTDVGPGSPP